MNNIENSSRADICHVIVKQFQAEIQPGLKTPLFEKSQRPFTE
jgi:hypothetical protein